MQLIDYISLIAGVTTLISVCLNIVQWRHRKSLITALKSRSQASYNYFFNVAYRSDYIRELKDKDLALEEKLNFAIHQAYGITGTADAARNDIISYCREHLNFIPVEEHPANPLIEPLPKPGKNISGQTIKKEYPRWGRSDKRS